MTNYSNFSLFYDDLTKNISYPELANYYDNLISQYDVTKGILLDLACGTGSLPECFAKMGYDVIGVDISSEMLSIAYDKKYNSNADIVYLCQDMCNLDLYGTIDITICSLDSINHLDSVDSIQKCFNSVSLFTNPDGLFIFDLNTPYKHKNILANETFIYDTDNVFCVWQNTFSENNFKVDIDLDFFEKNGDCYYRSEEHFSEIAFDTEFIDNLLIKAGFEVLNHYDYPTFQDVKVNSEKITFIARKVK